MQMYIEANMDLWGGRIDAEDKELGKRWHQKIKALPYPYKDKKGVAFLGFECDEGVKRNKGRVGARFGGDELKKSMGNFAYHLYDTRLYDCGKITTDTHLEEAQINLAMHIKTLLSNNHFPVILGGGHEVAYGSFLGLFDFAKKGEDIAIINFDAHFDLRQSELATSGTPFNQMARICQKNGEDFNYMCLGISKASNTQALFKRADELDVKYILDTDMNYLNIKKIKRKIKAFLKDKKYIYISIDTDAFCPYLVPAVSAVSSRGIEISLTHEILKYLFKKYNDKIKLIDIAEFNPKYDINNIAKKTISRLIYDIISKR